MSRLRANCLLLLAGAVWGMGFVAQSTAMDAVGPWTYTAAKFALAALTLLPFALWESRRVSVRIPTWTWGGFALVGAALFLAAITQQIGLLETTVTNSGFLTGLYVVLTPVLALVLLRSHPHWIVWPAALAAFAGIVLLGGGSLSALGPGDLWTIVSAVFWSVQILLIGIFASRGGRPYTLSLAQFTVTAVLAAVGAGIMETPDLAAMTAAWPEIVYGGVFSSGLAFTLQILGQRHTTAAQASIFLSSEALFAALFGALLLGERIPSIGFLGCGLIFAAMLAVELVPVIARRGDRRHDRRQLDDGQASTPSG
ncbi:DMT family transporter [Aurantimonas sp. VKM B-3413]|uniref:DMT family transporter n=1 Tax=Aurantimonas sp. VKM B-3413 TaxID=2779401 RepID=UPI001E4BC0A4|nr:DMT family transporter [Aurantimonas sp. VKM B-3413]MCB8836512.1 DMT family transporter [Aurantimonas sp. VKM B-3413]